MKIVIHIVQLVNVQSCLVKLLIINENNGYI